MTDPPKTYYVQILERIAAQQPVPEHQYLLLRQSRAFIEQYHAEKLELDKMAAIALMSRFHYIRMFQRIYGITPRQYLKDVRINQAKRLLKQGLPVTRVCLEVGYESLPTFSSAFKRGTGHSPQAYQKINFRNPE